MPHRKHRPPPHHARPSPTADRDRGPLERALAEVVPVPRDRAFVLRCILDEGPPHHRGASYALLRVLAEALERAGGVPPSLTERRAVPLRMRLPPHLGRAHDDDDYPLGLPTAALDELFGEGRARDELVAALSDGPPHHALANAAMMWLVEALLLRIDELARAARPPREPESGP